MNSPTISSSRASLAVDGDDVDVRYLHGGDGPPLVFLHGIGLDAAAVSWRHALPALAGEFSVYALDLPGHGESDGPDRTYTTDYYVDVLGSFLEAMGIRGAGLVGISMGGAVALGHALDGGSPERLVLVDSYGLGADAYWRQAASAALRIPFASSFLWGSVSSRAGVRTNLQGLLGSSVPEELVDDVHGAVSGRSMDALRSWQRHEFRPDGLRTDYRSRLGDLSTPTLLVHGEHDPLFPVSWSREASERLSAGELRVFDRCGHWVPRECPEAFNGLVRDFCLA
ncbi:Pimeloyl-ACP methyl ester carboxylesterase [Halomicrobium zhouii]|uniref:Pimeloyl-ACP methyl ester carboxylesterase n=1 Tax=Halomicrobium zhouii TaxID=767519 RepID=A0A1I6K5W5_9EURY|nr:alpha/beta hydrolase [Halomicrobium zhouii]SFR86629.1 Pimeloyl-ACP methyl ester carboxylesterase [Halomicrobium zhouii]